MYDEEESLIVSTKTEYDEVENVLRPKSMDGYIGQEKAKTNLSVFMQSAKLRGEPLDHVLLYGPPGLGKTTLAHIIAAEMGVQIKVTSGPSIEKSGDLAAILTNLNEGDVLFIDEIHRLNHNVEEILYPAMEDFSLDFIIGADSAQTFHACRSDDQSGYAQFPFAGQIRRYFKAGNVFRGRTRRDSPPLGGNARHSGVRRGFGGDREKKPRHAENSQQTFKTRARFLDSNESRRNNLRGRPPRARTARNRRTRA